MSAGAPLPVYRKALNAASVGRNSSSLGDAGTTQVDLKMQTADSVGRGDARYVFVGRGGT